MDPYGVVEVTFSGARLHRHCNALNNFTRIWADHMATQHAIRVCIDHKLHSGLSLAIAKTQLDRPKAALKYLEVTPGGYGLFFA